MGEGEMSYNIPKNLLYTKEHEWLKKVDERKIVTGISDYAQQKLGEITYIEFTKNVNDTVKQFEEYAVVNTQKSSEPVYSPVSGKIIELNEKLLEDPAIVHEQPYDSGWFAKIETTSLGLEKQKLMTSEQYQNYIKEIEKE